jgi:hypothetical protein
MSDWSDEVSGYSLLAQDAWEANEERVNFRTEVWTTRHGQEIAIRDMDDRHLFYAYKLSQDELLFREMVLRLFEGKMKK